MNKKEIPIIAIIGAGPRGLSALESLYATLANQSLEKDVKTILFEETDQFGNGQVYHRGQPDTNWLNVSERGLTIPARHVMEGINLKTPAFPSYQEWSGFNAEEDTGSIPDYFTKRSQMGAYLSQRFQSIAKLLIQNGLLELVQEKVVSLDYEKSRFAIKTDSGKYYADECVLTIGHQPTNLDEQMSKWKMQVSSIPQNKLVINPYPIENVLKNVESGDVVALRGFGLAMIDVARALSEGVGGRFQLLDKVTRRMTYATFEKNMVHLVPFSLNGLPMTPKPLNLDLDRPYLPTEDELKLFEDRLNKSLQDGAKLQDARFLITAITPLIVEKYLALEEKADSHTLSNSELEKIVEQWLEDGSTVHELIIAKSLAAYDSVQAFIDMATGSTKISLDYCIGQVWRHCQPMMYKALSFTDLADEVIAEVIQLDERLKRYSYGPPVDSLSQVLALVDAGIMTLDFVNDPEITFSNQGWELLKNDKNIVATVMVDTVLDSPKLLEVKSPLVKSLLSESLVEPIHSSLGISTDENAVVELDREKEIIPLAVLGRLAKGTIIGVDAILECFGERSGHWAEGVVERFKDISKDD